MLRFDFLTFEGQIRSRAGAPNRSKGLLVGLSLLLCTALPSMARSAFAELQVWGAGQSAAAWITLAQERRILIAPIPIMPLPTPAPSRIPLPGYIPPSSAIESIDEPLSRDEIFELQRGLAALGYVPGPIDGIAGPQTRDAIARFEADLGEKPTGRPTMFVLQAIRTAIGR